MGYFTARIAMNGHQSFLMFSIVLMVWFACIRQAAGVVLMTDLIPDLVMGPAGINSFDVDINGDGIRDVRIRAQGGSIGFEAIADPHVRLQGIADDPGSALAWRITEGSIIGSIPDSIATWMYDPPNVGFGLTACVVFVNLTCFGYFTLTQGYVGVEMSLPDGIHYGWIDVEGFFDAGNIRRWAWETEPGVPITAPEPSRSVAVAVAWCAWLLRRRRNLHH